MWKQIDEKTETVEFALTFEFGPSVTDECGACFYSTANKRREIKMFLQFLLALTLFIFI